VHIFIQKNVLWLQISVDDAKTMQVFNCHQQLSSIKPTTGDVKRAHFGDVWEQLPILGICQHKVESLHVLECALKLYEEWNVRFLVETQNVQHLLLPLNVLPLSLPQYVPLLTHFNCAFLAGVDVLRQVHGGETSFADNFTKYIISVRTFGR